MDDSFFLSLRTFLAEGGHEFTPDQMEPAKVLFEEAMADITFRRYLVCKRLLKNSSELAKVAKKIDTSIESMLLIAWVDCIVGEMKFGSI